MGIDIVASRYPCLAFSASNVGDNNAVFTVLSLGQLLRSALFKGPTRLGDVFVEHFLQRKMFGHYKFLVQPHYNFMKSSVI